jgi:tRNA(Leu) C34 or U34 (ribose-2'-O)-methylase TrmL
VSIAWGGRGDPLALLAAEAAAPVVLLEDPRHFGNVGAVIRVAAAVEVAGVLTTGRQDPWDPVAVRGSAGLHFALPVARVEQLPPTDRPLLAFDPEGEELRPELVPGRALLAFGTERAGLSKELLGRADTRLRLTMREGVPSRNLEPSVEAEPDSVQQGGRGHALSDSETGNDSVLGFQCRGLVGNARAQTSRRRLAVDNSRAHAASPIFFRRAASFALLPRI